MARSANVSSTLQALEIGLPTAKLGDISGTPNGDFLAEESCDCLTAIQIHRSNRKGRKDIPHETPELGRWEFPNLQINRSTGLGPDAYKARFGRRGTRKREKLVGRSRFRLADESGAALGKLVIQRLFSHMGTDHGD
jgi:hypothetical protein